MMGESNTDLAALGKMALSIFSRAPAHLKNATKYEVLKYLAERNDKEAVVVLDYFTTPEMLRWYEDLFDAAVWDNWSVIELSKEFDYQPTEKSRYSDCEELVEAYREAQSKLFEEAEENAEKWLAEMVREGKIERIIGDDGEIYWGKPTPQTTDDES